METGGFLADEAETQEEPKRVLTKDGEDIPNEANGSGKINESSDKPT